MARLLAVALKGAAALSGIVVLGVSARLLDLADFGRFALIISVAQIAASMVAAGFGRAGLRWIPTLRFEGDPHQVGGFTGAALRWIALNSLAFTLFLYLILSTLPDGPLASDLAGPLGVLAYSLAVLELLSAYARAAGRQGTAIFAGEIGYRLAFVALGIGLRPDSIGRAAWIYAGSALFSVLVMTIWLVARTGLRPCLRGAVVQRWSPFRSASVRAYWGLSLVTVALAQADIVVAGLVLEPEVLASYAVAKRVALLVSFFLLAANYQVATDLSERFARGETRLVQALLTSAAAFATWPSLVLSVAIGLFGTHVLVLFDEDLKQASGVLIVLLVAQVVNAASGSTNVALANIGGEAVSLRLTTFALIVSTVLVAVLGVGFGALGAAVASLVGMCIQNATIVRVLKRDYKLDPTIRPVLARVVARAKRREL